jgi:hypothetical protein
VLAAIHVHGDPQGTLGTKATLQHPPDIKCSRYELFDPVALGFSKYVLS